MADVKSQISAMVQAYTKYIKGKSTSQGVADTRKAVKASEEKRNKNRAA